MSSYVTFETSNHVQTPVYHAATWHLDVANERGSGSVECGENQFDRVREGDIIEVIGREGHFTHYWFLSQAIELGR